MSVLMAGSFEAYTPPRADAGPDQNVTLFSTVSFDGSASHEIGTATYTWSFEDDGLITLTGVSPSYQFNNSGAFTVMLAMTDDEGPHFDSLVITVAGWIVDINGSGDFSTIQEAVDAASGGESIFVYSGLYQENLSIHKSLNLIGNGSDSTVINGSDHAYAINITADNVSMRGFNITSNDPLSDFESNVINIESCNNCTIEDNLIFGGTRGILLENSIDSSVVNNSFLTTPFGIMIQNSLNAIATENSFDGMGIGALLFNSHGSLLEYNDFSAGIFAIGLMGADDNNVSNNNLSSANSGLFSLDSSDNAFVNNNVSRCGVGIGLSASSNCSLIGNNLSDNEIGVEIFDCINISMVNNALPMRGINVEGCSLSNWDSLSIDTSNTIDGKAIYYWKDRAGGNVPEDAGQIFLVNCSAVTIEDHGISGCYVAIVLAYSDGNTIVNNNATANENGLFLFVSHENYIGGNNLSSNGYAGIKIEHSDFNIFTDNVIKNTRYGMYFEDSDNNTVSDNIASFNEDHGINFYHNCHNNSVTGNSVSFNDRSGITLFDNSCHNSLTNNIAQSNMIAGIGLDGSSNHNLVVNNTVRDSIRFGILINDSDFNTITHNNIIDNANQSSDNGVNDWNAPYPNGGNYWSDYNGGDVNYGSEQDSFGSDGIGDTAYGIANGDNQDRYPLMRPWFLDSEAPIAEAGTDQIFYKGDTVALNASGSTDNVGIANYTWSFIYGEEVKYFSMEMEYIFSIPGVYQIILNISDSAGNWDTDQVTLTVNNVIKIGPIMNEMGHPLSGVLVTLDVNGVEYNATTDQEGTVILIIPPCEANTPVLLHISINGYVAASYVLDMDENGEIPLDGSTLVREPSLLAVIPFLLFSIIAVLALIRVVRD